MLPSSVYNDNQSFPITMTNMAKTATTTRIAVSGYKNSRKSHVGIHLWEAPSSSSMTNNSRKRKQIMIVHIDDHSIFASPVTNNTASKESSSTAQHHPESVPATLKVGMKLISVNGATIRQHHSIQDIYTMLQNAIGCVTLIVGTPTIATNTIDNDNSLADEKICSDVWMQQDYDRIPDMKPLIANEEYTSSSSSSASSAASSFSSSASTSHQSKWNNSCINEDSDDEDEDESILNNAYALENRIRSIWSPILTNGSGSISNRQRQR